jgi:hypothetical protein
VVAIRLKKGILVEVSVLMEESLIKNAKVSVMNFIRMFPTIWDLRIRKYYCLLLYLNRFIGKLNSTFAY